MAALIGTLQGQRGEASRLGSKNSGIRSRLATWDGAIFSSLEADGSFVVTIEPFRGSGSPVTIRGNVNTGQIEENLDGSLVEFSGVE